MSGSGRREIVPAGRWAETGARLVTAALERRAAAASRLAVALAGGSTPRALYRALAGEPWRRRLPWRRVDLFWGDERCVPPSDAESNYRMAAETLLAGLALAPGQIHRIRGELAPPEAARDAEREIRRHVGGEPPRFDLLLLGLGEDGHTASLFPDSGALLDSVDVVVATRSPEPPRARVSLTLATINAARSVLFLVRGRSKAEMVARILAPADAPDGEPALPAARVRPTDGELVWLLDEAAAERLPPVRSEAAR